MKKDDHIKYWLESAEHDLETAESLLFSGKYDWSLFIGHLVLEKGFKAIFVSIFDNQVPPKIHNLVKLSELTHLNLNEDKRVFLDEVNDFNLEVRYPEYKDEFYKTCTKEYAEKYINEIKEMFTWLKSQIK